MNNSITPATDSNQLDENEMAPSLKKRKLSTNSVSSTSIELEVLQFENKKLKEYVKKLESERHTVECNNKKILELEASVKKLEANNADLHVKNEQCKKEMDSEYTGKIKALEDEQQKFEAKIQELIDKITTMKTNESEIKDTVENERESQQAEIDKLNTENKELKKQNNTLEQINQSLLENHEKEIKNLKEKKETSEKMYDNHLTERQICNAGKLPKYQKSITAFDKDVELPILYGGGRTAKLFKGEQMFVIKMSEKTYMKRIIGGNDIFNATLLKYHDDSVIELD